MVRSSFNVAAGNPLQPDQLPEHELPFDFACQGDTSRGFTAARARAIAAVVLIDALALSFRFFVSGMQLDMNSNGISVPFVIVFVVVNILFSIAAPSIHGAKLLVAIVSTTAVSISLGFIAALYPTACYLVMAVLQAVFVLQFGRHWIERCTVSPLAPHLATGIRQSKRRQLYIYSTIPLIAGFAATLFNTPIVMMLTLVPVGIINFALAKPRTNPIRSALVALTSWCGYGQDDIRVPGVWRSPAGSQTIRITTLILSAFCFAISFEMTMRGAAVPAAPLSFLLLPATAFAFSPILLITPIITDLFTVRRGVSRSSVWKSIVREMRESPNQIIRNSYYQGHVAADGSPLFVHRSTMGEHAHFLGTSGGNKTSKGLCPAIEQTIGFGDRSVVVMDLKGDSLELLASMAAGADVLENRTGVRLPLRVFSSKFDLPSYGISLFDNDVWRSLPVNEQTDIICNALGVDHGTDYGASHFSSANASVIKTALQKGDVRTLSQLADQCRINFEGLRPRTLEYDIAKDGLDVYEELKRLADFPQLQLQRTSPEFAEAIDFQQMFQEPQLLYVHLPSTVSARSAPVIGRMLIRFLMAAASQTERHCGVTLVIDEFQRLSAKSLDYLFQLARSLDISVVLSNQSMEDLKSLKSSMIPTIEANCQYRQWFDVGNMEDVERIERIAGQTVETIMSRSVSTSANGGVTHGESQILVPRLSTNEINTSGSSRDLSIVRIGRDKGYAQYGRFPFIVRSDYHISEDEYTKRRAYRWPEQTTGMLIPRDHGAPEQRPSSGQGGVVIVTETDGVEGNRDERLPSDLDDLFGLLDDQRDRKRRGTDDTVAPPKKDRQPPADDFSGEDRNEVE